ASAARRIAARTRAVAAVRRTAAIALRFASGAAVGTTARLAKPAARVEILLAAGKRKCLTAIAAGQGGIGRHRRRLPSQNGSASWAFAERQKIHGPRQRAINKPERNSLRQLVAEYRSSP